jgi:DNA-binding MarR family transcriptional regulator
MQAAMAKIDATKVWSLNYRLVSATIVSVAPQLAALHLETKELFLLAAIDEHPHPAALADTLCMPKPTVTVYLKRLVAANFVRREIDAGDLRRHRLNLTPAGRKVMVRGLALLSAAYGARLSRLSGSEQSQFAMFLEKLV